MTPSKRLANYNPSLTYSAQSGAPFTHQLSMDCPACGPAFRLVICCVLGPPPGPPGVWGLSLPERPSGDGYDGWTMMPSYANNGHGRKRACGVHFSIVNGHVVP